MSQRSKPGRIAAVRRTYPTVTTRALGRATTQSIGTEGNHDGASSALDTRVGLKFSGTHSAHTLERFGRTPINPADFAFRTTACRMVQGSPIDSKSGNYYDCQVAAIDGNKFMLPGV